MTLRVQREVAASVWATLGEALERLSTRSLSSEGADGGLSTERPS